MKKRVLISVATIVVAIAIIALLAFVFSGENKESTISLNGVWKVAVNVNDGIVSIPQNEYMVFNDTDVSDYRDGNAEAYAKSTFKISGDVLELTDISRTYRIARQTDNYISLYTSEKTYMTIVKAENEEFFDTEFEPSTITGKWNVVFRPTEKPITNEYLVFDDGLLYDYRDNSEQPVIEAKYEWNGNVIKAPDLGMEMLGANIGTDRIILIDINEGYVWLLSKAET